MKIKYHLMSGLLLTALLLAGCSSGSDSDSDASDAETSDAMSSDTVSETETDSDSSTGTFAPGASSQETRLFNFWASCADIRSEYNFTRTTFSTRWGVGDCDGFISGGATFKAEGTYSVDGSTTTDSGLTALVLKLEIEEGVSEFDESSFEGEFRYQVVHLTPENRLFFSEYSDNRDDLVLTLDFDRPYDVAPFVPF